MGPCFVFHVFLVSTFGIKKLKHIHVIRECKKYIQCVLIKNLSDDLNERTLKRDFLKEGYDFIFWKHP